MSMLARILAPLSFDSAEERKENHAEANRRQTERLLRDELGHQWSLAMIETDPEKRLEALAEIKRIEELLGDR